MTTRCTPVFQVNMFADNNNNNNNKAETSHHCNSVLFTKMMISFDCKELKIRRDKELIVYVYLFVFLENERFQSMS